MKKRYPVKNNVLLVNITRLGDMLQATPTVAGMKQENPDCKVTVLVEKQFEDVCYWIPNIDEVLSLDLGMTVRSLTREGDGIVDAFEYIDETVTDLRSRSFDYCLNMSSSAYTALLLRLVGVERNGGWRADPEGYRIIESDWARLFATSVFHQNRQYNSLNLVDVFRCSADVEEHPKKLLINVTEESREYCHRLVEEAQFSNTGPLIAVQAGASQGKRQWAPAKFIRFLKIMVEEHNARIIMTGSKKELEIINRIKAGIESSNVFVAAGKTTFPQLAAFLEMSAILITGDTGPMHLSVAVGTPVIAMFLASAFGFVTGPYSAGNIILQPVVGCAPCNPNKPCTRPDCHDMITPDLLASLTALRLKEDFRSLPVGFCDPNKVIIYRSDFDSYGFCDLFPLNTRGDDFTPFRQAYRSLWLDELGGYLPVGRDVSFTDIAWGKLPIELRELQNVIIQAEEGIRQIERLIELIKDERSPAAQLGVCSEKLAEIDRNIEQIGFHNGPLGPLTRMFVFAKENLLGTEAS
jgi:ADP-heptose:LPS heptosyltransferase